MPKPAKVLLYDIESFPHTAFTWGTYETNVIAFQRERLTCSIAWKWLGNPQIECLALPMFKTYPSHPFDNTLLIKAFHKVLCQADISIAHNGDRFDDKMVNTDIIKKGLKPPDPRKTVDTLKVARRYFSFASNRLDALGESLNVGRKVKHPGFEMWLGCMNGDPKSWDLMIKYNRGDVALLEKVYYKLRPWIANHPDLSNFTRSRSCPNCESRNIISKGWDYSRHYKRPRYKCRNCGRAFYGGSQKAFREDS